MYENKEALDRFKIEIANAEIYDKLKANVPTVPSKNYIRAFRKRRNCIFS